MSFFSLHILTWFSLLFFSLSPLPCLHLSISSFFLFVLRDFFCFNALFSSVLHLISCSFPFLTCSYFVPLSFCVLSRSRVLFRLFFIHSLFLSFFLSYLSQVFCINVLLFSHFSGFSLLLCFSSVLLQFFTYLCASIFRAFFAILFKSLMFIFSVCMFLFPASNILSLHCGSLWSLSSYFLCLFFLLFVFYFSSSFPPFRPNILSLISPLSSYFICLSFSLFFVLFFFSSTPFFALYCIKYSSFFISVSSLPSCFLCLLFLLFVFYFSSSVPRFHSVLHLIFLFL